MARTIQDAYIVAAVRTPVGKRNGAFRYTRPDDLLAHAIRSTLARCPTLDPAAIADVVVGCAIPEAEQGLNVARVGSLLAGLPDAVPAFTINRYCSSGLNAVAIAADRIRLGEADVVVAGGVESMSVMTQMLGNKPAANPRYFTDDNRALAYGMGLTAERVAERWSVSREAQDAFAATSHQRAVAAIAAGAFRDEIAPYTTTSYSPNLANGKVDQRQKNIVDDEGPRADASVATLAKLKPVFALKGSVTAGNASQMSDGAAAVLLMSEAALKRYQVEPIGRFVSFAVAGVAPEVMGIGPIEAIPKALALAQIKEDDLAHIELNEAFAAQALAVMNELHLDPERVNPQGGAIALGHPLGATGAIRVATLLSALKRKRERYGMVSMCIGAGMGAAGVFEAL